VERKKGEKAPGIKEGQGRKKTRGKRSEGKKKKCNCEGNWEIKTGRELIRRMKGTGR